MQSVVSYIDRLYIAIGFWRAHECPALEPADYSDSRGAGDRWIRHGLHLVDQIGAKANIAILDADPIYSLSCGCMRQAVLLSR